MGEVLVNEDTEFAFDLIGAITLTFFVSRRIATPLEGLSFTQTSQPMVMSADTIRALRGEAGIVQVINNNNNKTKTTTWKQKTKKWLSSQSMMTELNKFIQNLIPRTKS